MTTERRDAFYHRGWTLRAAGRAELAAREFERAIEVDPRHARSFAMLALCRIDSGDSAGAVSAASTALSLDPSDPFTNSTMAWTLHDTGKFEAALAHAMEALRLEPESSDGLRLITSVRCGLGQHDAALESIERAAAIDPQSAAIHRSRSFVLWKLGRLSEARIAAEAGLRIDPDSAWSHLALARVVAAQDDAKAAVVAYREALRLRPSDAEARQGLLWALKRRNPLFRRVSQFHSWFEGLGSTGQITICVFVVLCSGGFAFPLVVPALLAGHAVDPVANLVLRIDRSGRHLLTASQIVSADTLAAFLLAGAALLLALPFGAGLVGACFAAFVAALVPTIATIPNCRSGWAGVIVAAYAGAWIFAAVLLAVWAGHATTQRLRGFSNFSGPPELTMICALACIATVLGPICGPRFAQVCGYPWSHRFDTPSR